MKHRKQHCKRLVALVLALAVIMTFQPLLGGGVSAAATSPSGVIDFASGMTASVQSQVAGTGMSQSGLTGITQETIIDVDAVDLDEAFDFGEITAEEAGLTIEAMDAVAEDDENDEALSEVPEAPLRAQNPEEKTLAATKEDVAAAGPGILPMTAQESSDAAGGITVSSDTSTGLVSVSGAVTGDRFSYVALVDSALNVQARYTVNAAQFGALTFDMSAYPIGGYYIVAFTTGGRTYNDAVLSQIYDKPANALSQYETYAKYLFYTPPSPTYYRTDTDCGLYLDLRVKSGKKWGEWKTYGPFTSTNATQITGLKPNRKYQARSYYGKIVTINGTNFFFSGLDNKKYKTVTIKTAKKKLPIKSVTVKAVKIKKHTHKRYGSATGLYLGKETWYTYRLKVTVKMKKKPGVKGIYINGKKVKGNKKTYSVTFGRVSSILTGKHVIKTYKNKWWRQDDTYKIPRGSKYVVKLYSYSNKTYKAYTLMQTRKAKVR